MSYVARLAGIICPLSLVWVMIGGEQKLRSQPEGCVGVEDILDKSSGMTRRRTHYLKEVGKAG